MLHCGCCSEESSKADNQLQIYKSRWKGCLLVKGLAPKALGG